MRKFFMFFILLLTVKTVANAQTKKTFTVNNVSFDMIYVQGGTFMMGSEEEDASKDEIPVHQVTLSSYYIGQTEVTLSLWNAVMGNNRLSRWDGHHPVDNVSWKDCKKFIKKLNKLTKQNFRLPTEAEWEFAARGGNNSLGYVYSGSNIPFNVAWFKENSGVHHQRVATKQPNELGIYDMTGNVDEWCEDWLGYYNAGSQTNPKGPNRGKYKIIRGGGFFDPSCSKVYERGCNSPSTRYPGNGFRLVL